MADQIGKAALVLTAESTGLSKGLRETENETGTFFGRLRGKIDKGLKDPLPVARAGGKAIGGALTGALSGFMAGAGLGALAGGWGAVIAAPLGAITGGLGGGAGGAVETIQKVADTAKKARALNIDGEQYTGLQRIFAKAHIEGDAFDATLTKMTAKISAAAGGNQEMAGSFAALSSSFDSAGIDLAKLNAMSPDAQFKAIAQGIASIADPGERARVSLKLFEDAGTKLLPTLTQGAAGIDRMIDKQKKLGGTLTGRELALAERAAAALPKAETAIDNLKTKMMIASAPILERWANVGTAIINKLTPAFNWVIRLTDSFGTTFGAVWEEVLYWVDLGATALGDWLGGIFGTGQEMVKLEDVVNYVGLGLVDIFAHVGKYGAQGLSYVVEAAGWLVKHGSNALVIFQGLFAAAAEIPGTIGDSAKAALNYLDQLEPKLKVAGDDMQNWARKVRKGAEDFDADAGAAEFWARVQGRIAKREEELNKLQEKGKKAGDEIEKAISPSRFQTILRGSSEAFQVEARIKTANDHKPVIDAIKQGNAVAAQANGILKDIANKMTIWGAV